MVRQLEPKRTALSLYAVLLVLPTLVLGLLHWYQLALDHSDELDAVPKKADDAALRLVESVDKVLARLVRGEEQRPFYHYAELYVPETAHGENFALVRSPLVRSAAPEGVLAWFSYNLRDGPGAAVDVYRHRSRGADDEDAASETDDMQLAARELADRNALNGLRVGDFGQIQTVDLPLLAAAVNQTKREALACVQQCAPLMHNERLSISYSRFHLQFYREYADGTPRVVATRRVMLSQPLHGLHEQADCLGPIADGAGIVQGFFVDPDWLFHRLPAETAEQVLSGSERFLPMGEARVKYQGEEYQSEIWLVSDLGLETSTPEDDFFGLMKVAIDMGALKAHFRSQTWRFVGVAAMLALSLATGMALLMRSVSMELEQAQRMENFVAAVTHELRTPLSAIRLHGEMLLEGWAKDESTQREYHSRIVRETDRLSTLVERVLSKSKLAQGAAPAIRGKLNDIVDRLAHELSRRGVNDVDDLVFELEDDLPPVWLSQEAISGILTNLVENARKYAPVDPGNPSSGPIRIRTGMHGGRVVLEVIDRGPGIPAEDREQIFEAFFRSGSEATRTTQGTGLGLHLVKLHAEAVGATAGAHAGPDGSGALFRIRFRSA